jgi:hypothetical protein
MDSFRGEKECNDAMFNHGLSDAEPDDSSLAGDDELRLAGIEEYRQESRRIENKLQANMATINAGLFHLAFLSEKALINASQSAPDNFLATSHGQRALTSHLCITRQAERFANFDARLEEAKKRDENAKTQRRMSALQAPAGAKYPMR